MYEFFKLMHTVANSDAREFTSIKDLTIAIVKDAGYRRGMVQLKNGKMVERTIYNPATYDISENGQVRNYKSAWDDALVAKWFCYYEKLFLSKLIKHPELHEYFIQIIQRTFSIYIAAFNIDKCLSDASITRTVNLCLINRIGEVLYFIETENKLEKYNNLTKLRKSEDQEVAAEAKKAKNRIVFKWAINNSTVSIDYMQEILSTGGQISYDDDKFTYDPLLLSIRHQLGNNTLGLRLLDAMLQTDFKMVKDKNSNESKQVIKSFNFAKLADYIKFEEHEVDTKEHKQESLNKLEEAYEIIKDALQDALYENGSADKYDWDKKPNMKINDSNAINNRIRKANDIYFNNLSKEFSINCNKLKNLYNKLKLKHPGLTLDKFKQKLKIYIFNHKKAV